MFTGLIQKTGRVLSVNVTAEEGRLVVQASPWETPLAVGESIAVSGACLTLASFQGDRLTFDALQETFQRTNLGRKKPGDRVNLERALRAGDALGGHLVTGHVDGIGIVRGARNAGRDWVLEVEVAEALRDGLVPKGSVTCDGISLTVVSLSDRTFSVHIIPHTWTHTTLADLNPGDPVNIETDILGKYVKRLLSSGGGGSSVTMDSLRRAGFIN
ncbi:MAG TPA: riboflavin synthase [Kiritimatiellia bacterium]|nr:riboflavin synthase [Kiritimatiellia bacterium]HRZ12914.1 riboflavin synthase [Kiritimatiellia bacterium]HSA18476.1 riboflavin synthase [Kiritimatiellia bacterium]